MSEGATFLFQDRFRAELFYSCSEHLSGIESFLVDSSEVKWKKKKKKKKPKDGSDVFFHSTPGMQYS